MFFEKLVVTQQVKQYPDFFMEPEGSFTVFTKARNWTLS
jgi:hypothetical protein